ncbi:hypothetical protein WEI85_01265 [Actinomycetes bacterium KLBMP 9797]
MRHLWSLLAGVVAAPAAWVLVSVGQDGSTSTVTGWVESGRYDTVDLIEPAAYLLVAGIVLGLLGTLRFSPLGPLVAGLLLVGPYAGLFVDPLAVRDAVPDNWEVLDRELALRQPLDNGTLLLLGALLVMAAFSLQRWRRWPEPATPSAYEPEPRPDDTPTDPLITWSPAPASPAPTLSTTSTMSSPTSTGSATPTEVPVAGANPWTTPPTRPGPTP